MLLRVIRRALAAIIATALFLLPNLLVAEPHTTSDLLLPYFEVDLNGNRTTLFAVGNVDDQATDVRVTVATNWGIPVLGVNLRLDPGMVQTVNLSDWLIRGTLPGRTLSPAQRAHIQAALSGQPSHDPPPDEGLYYGSEVEPDLMVGYVTLRALGNDAERADSLWGDYFWVDPNGDFAEGDVLADIDRVKDCPALCDRHVLRFLEAGVLDGGTQVIIWVDRPSVPSPQKDPLVTPMTLSGEAFYTEPGVRFDNRVIELLATQSLPLRDLLLEEPFGWLDMATEEPAFVGVRYSAQNRFAVTLQSWCVDEPPAPIPVGRHPSIDIEKFTNGVDADQPAGPILKIGSTVTWEYRVTNTGNARLTGIVVSDNQGVAVTCPKTTLNPHEAMVCLAAGTALPGQYGNIGTVTGNPPEGSPVTDSDPSHYFGTSFVVGEPAIGLEKMTNGQDADDPTGPTIVSGNPVTWTYRVTNIGGTGLTGISVADSDPTVTVVCPKTSLDIGDSMVCSAGGVAEEGQYANVGTASGTGDGRVVTATDPSHYYGVPPNVLDEPAIHVEKLTNGFDADGVASAPHLVHGDAVIWTYVVTNTGSVTLSDIAVTDDQGVAVSCPRTTLDPGESMVCTGSGTAVASEACYANVGTAVGTPPEGDDVTDSDPSHYCAEEIVGEPAVHLEKYTNGQDADVAPGPTLAEGDNVQWTYVVTNTGEVTLTGVTVTDNRGVAITCEGGQPFALEPAETMLCFGNGTATIGQYSNEGSVCGTPDGGGEAVCDTDPSHYFGEEPAGEPGIDLEKATNGEDADLAPGPTVPLYAAFCADTALGSGSLAERCHPVAQVTWTYVVTNTGSLPLAGITVGDDVLGPITCPKTSLAPGESMTCTATGAAEAGPYENLGTACGTPSGGQPICDDDPSHYYGQDEAIGDEGCTPGYWKNHTDSWPPTGYSTGQTVQSVFSAAMAYPDQGSASLLEALDFGGGPGVTGGVKVLLRAAVAALLDASHPGVDYPRTTASVISSVNTALASGSRDAMLTLANSLDADNNQGCPLN